MFPVSALIDYSIAQYNILQYTKFYIDICQLVEDVY